MNVSESWNTFLRTQGAVHNDDASVRDFGDAAAERRAARDADVLVDLSPLSLIRVSGADAKTFLNTQLTNDVTALAVDQTQLAAWCSPKGRMLAIFRVIRRADDYLLQLPAPLRDDIIKRLRVYVLRSKVTLESIDDRVIRIGVAGPQAAASIQRIAGGVPDVDNSVTTPALTASRVPGLHPRFEILASLAEAPAIWKTLRQNATPAGWGAWVWHDIMAGIPVVWPETHEAFVPQMANLDAIGGVNFKKGCYPGQEIVARVHYRGRIKERMFRAHIEPNEIPKAGESVYAPDLPGQSAGTVVSAQPSPNGGGDLLAVIHLSSAQTGELRVARPDGPRLTLEPLPYSVPTP